jgi:hypothetical protein
MSKLRLERWGDEGICRLYGLTVKIVDGEETGGKGYGDDMTGLEGGLTG